METTRNASTKHKAIDFERSKRPESPKLSERIAKYLEMASTAPGYIGLERAKLVTESYKQTESLPNCLRRAHAVAHILKNMTIDIEPYTLIAGNLTECGCAKNAPLFPETYRSEMAERAFVKGEPQFPWEKPPGEERWLVKDPEEFKSAMKEILAYWKGRTAADAIYPMLGDEVLKAQAFDGLFVFNKDWYFNYGDGHFIPDYPYFLKNGVKENIRRCRQKIGELEVSEPDAIYKRAFWQAVIISNEAVINFAHRYANLASEMAEKESDRQRREDLKRIAAACQWVPENPPRSLYEAIQMIYFIHLPIHIEDGGHSVSFGRLDQYLYPFYESDRQKMPRDEILELVENLYIKIWQIGKWLSEGDAKFLRGRPMFENLTIGGMNPNGSDTTNDLSYIMLEAKYNVRQTEPQLTARWHPNAPEKYKMECVRVIRMGIGQPAVFNDLCITSGMMNMGYELQEAYDYGIVGCTEPHPAGLISGNVGGPQFNISKVVELTLHGGKDPRTGICLKTNKNCKNLSTFSSFEEVWDAFVDQLKYYHTLWNELQNAGEIAFEEHLDEPLASSFGGPRFTVERGKGFKKGGGKYDWNTDNIGAVATAGNSLAAVKWLVFDKKLLTGAQLLHALNTNFEDMTTNPTGPVIHAMCVNAPKFGNDDDYVDFITRDVLKTHCENIMTFKTTRYGRGQKAARASRQGTQQVVI